MRYTELEKLEGVSSKTLRCLKAAGILCVETLSVADLRTLALRTKLGYEITREVIKKAKDVLGTEKFEKGTVREEELLRRPRLTTGLSKLDRILGGGLPTGSIVEIYGASRSGKSQWCHQLAVTTMLPDSQKGLGGNVLWVDTESSFTPRTIRAMALRWGLDPDVSLDRILVVTTVKQEQFRKFVSDLPRLVVDHDISMIMIDNLGGFFRFETMEDPPVILEQSQILLETFDVLRSVAHSLQCLVLYTNQVYEKMRFGYRHNAPVAEHLLAHQPTHRLHAMVGHHRNRKLRLKYNAGLPEADVEVCVGWGGFYKDKSEMKRAEAEIVPQIDALNESGSDTATAEEGMA